MDIYGWRSVVIMNYGSSGMPWEGKIDKISPALNEIEVFLADRGKNCGSNENHFKGDIHWSLQFKKFWELGSNGDWKK
jgi:hypothetical protein